MTYTHRPGAFHDKIKSVTRPQGRRFPCELVPFSMAPPWILSSHTGNRGVFFLGKLNMRRLAALMILGALLGDDRLNDPPTILSRKSSRTKPT
jgi:hypothetical protein